MSCLHHEEILEACLDAIQVDFPELSIDEQIKKAYELFEEYRQWLTI